MDWNNFYKKACEGVVFSDGAMGTLLQKKGLTGEDCPELWNVIHPEYIIEIQKAYVEAGSEMLTTNTFGGNRFKLKNYHLEDRLEELNMAGVKIALEAADGKAIVAASIGPTGKFIEPIGPLSFDEMVEIYKEQIIALEKAGAHVLDFETHVDILELKAGIIAAKEVSKLPIIANMTFEKDGRTVTGSTPEAAFTTLEALGVEIIGTNCSSGPSDMLKIVEKVRPMFSIPIITQANAGMPHIVDGETVFDEGPEEYSDKALKMVIAGADVIGGCCGTTPEHIEATHSKLYIEAGVNVIGGCCGTTPEHIRLLREKVEGIENKLQRTKKDSNVLKLSSRFGMMKIGFEEPFVAIGERLNPTARKKLARDIKNGEFILFKEEAVSQEEAGANILDLNMGIPNIDEPAMMKKGVEILSTTVKIPFAIDSSNPEACRVGMRYYPGKPLLNSISAEPERLALLPDVKKYGAAFIALPIDENGIPETVEERVKILKFIVNEAKKLGIEKKNIIADPLVLTASANQAGAKITLDTIKAFKEEVGVCSTMGLSNISFGLPLRQFVNRAFLAMSIANGATTAIVNPLDDDLMGVIRATDVLLSKDVNSAMYIKNYANKKLGSSGLKSNDSSGDNLPVDDKADMTIGDKLKNAVIKGNKDGILSLLDIGLKEGLTAIGILNDYLIPGITEVGELYDKKIYFLPQLMLSAETMKKAFIKLEPLLKEGAVESKGKIVFATVKGDVHDIGKNIVVIMMQNYGYDVYDLGRDVPNETVIEKAMEVDADVIALSALMTTTMPRMKEIMELIQEKDINIPVMVGGAAVTKEYADSIGAYYSQDAVSAVKLAEKILT